MCRNFGAKYVNTYKWGNPPPPPHETRRFSFVITLCRLQPTRLLRIRNNIIIIRAANCRWNKRGTYELVCKVLLRRRQRRTRSTCNRRHRCNTDCSAEAALRKVPGIPCAFCVPFEELLEPISQAVAST